MDRHVIGRTREALEHVAPGGELGPPGNLH